MSLLITNAFAETAPTAPASSTTTTSTTTAPNTPAASSSPGQSFLHMLPMLVLFILVFYFLLIRPQAKRAKEQKKLLSSITIGDEVMTAGGIVGKVLRLKDNFMVITIAKGVEITVQKSSVATVLPKGTMESTD
jgi:preprotein translocase subunit YajC